MLVATPGQTTTYSTLHNNSSNGAGSNNSAAAASTTKKSSTLSSTNTAASGTPKSLNNNNHTSSSTTNVTTKNSLNSNTHPPTSYNYHQNSKNDNIVSSKIGNPNKTAVTSSREIISTTITSATTHSLKNENSTNNTTTNKQQSFIQTLKDSVQKALISTTGNSGSSNNSVANKLQKTDSKLPHINCNNSTTSIQNVTSSSSSTSHNANKVSTTTSSNTSSSSAAATQSSSSVSLVRSKHFSCSISKLHTVAPTILHRYAEERQKTSSTDSLQKEMCHFKPIRIVPKTPWKSGSKSRGNSLRFPKANLATKKTEFVLKSNCDVNNRKKKQQNRTQNDKINGNEDENDDEQQENKEFYGIYKPKPRYINKENKEFYGIYKPKPSLTCLTTSLTTPQHQSAFVCLVDKMKSLVNLKSKRQLTPVKSSGAVSEGTSDVPIKELYVRKKQKPNTNQLEDLEVPKELPNIRSTRRLTIQVNRNTKLVSQNSNTTTIPNQATTKDHLKRTNAKINNISKVSTVAITKAKSRRKLGGAKSKTIDMVALAATKAKGKLQNSMSMPAVGTNKTNKAVTTSKSTRKRKLASEAVLIPNTSFSSSPKQTTSVKSLTKRARKSTRLTKDTSVTTTNTNKLTSENLPQNYNMKSPQRTRKKPTTFACFSPPLTRSRLKNLAEQGKIFTTGTGDIKKRKF